MLGGGCEPPSSIRTEPWRSGRGAPRKGAPSHRSWPTSSCTTRSIDGWRGFTRTSGSSATRTMRSSIAGARRRRGLCWRPSGVAWRTAVWSFIPRRPGSSTARTTTGRGSTNTSRFPSATRRNIYVGSEKAGQRVMESLTRFIERRLKLQVNADKSAVARPWERSFLGFTVRNDRAFRRCISAKAITRFKDRVRVLTRRHRGIPVERMIADLAPILRGWAGYFGFSQLSELQALDGWIRRRLRCVAWVQWKTRRRRYQELRRLGVSEKAASELVWSPKGPWRLSSTHALHRAYSNARFRKLGLPSMATSFTA